MSRRGRKRRGQRDASSPSLAELLAPVPSPLVIRLVTSPRLGEVEDGRRFTPEHRSPAKVDGTRFGGLKVADAVRGRVPGAVRLSQLAFKHGESVVRCVRRKDRREVIFAKKLNRKGAGASRRRRDFWSNVKC